MKKRNWALWSLASTAVLAAASARAPAQAPAVPPPAPAPASAPDLSLTPPPSPSETPAPAPPGQPVMRLEGQPNAYVNSGIAKPVAVVNGEAITEQEVDAEMKRHPLPSNYTEDQRRQHRMVVVSMLIDDRLLCQFLNANAPPASNAEVQKWFIDMEKNLKQEGHTLDEFYKERGLSADRLRGTVSGMLQWVSYVKAHLSDADVQRYYQENREFFNKVSVRASHILVRMPPTASPAERQTARAQLQALRQQIVAGKIDFAEAARKFSQCPSRERGGDLGYLQRKFIVPESFARPTFALRVNEISDVVETEAGLHLIKVTDRKAGEPFVYERMKEEVRDFAAMEMRQNVLAQQHKVSKVEVMDGVPALKSPPGSRP